MVYKNGDNTSPVDVVSDVSNMDDVSFIIFSFNFLFQSIKNNRLSHKLKFQKVLNNVRILKRK